MPGATVAEVACVRNKQSRDVGRYDSRDGGGRAAPGAAAEGNAGDPHGRGKVGAASGTAAESGCRSRRKRRATTPRMEEVERVGTGGRVGGESDVGRRSCTVARPEHRG